MTCRPFRAIIRPFAAVLGRRQPARTDYQGATLDIERSLESLGIASRPLGGGGYRVAAGPGRITRKLLTQDELISMLLADPFRTQRQLAAETGYSESWLSRIISSDLFQAKLAERLEKEIEPARQAAVQARFGEIEARAKASLSRCLDLLETKLEQPAEQLELEAVLKSGDFAAKLAGYGGKNTQPPAVQVNMDVHLQEMSENMVRLFKSARADSVIEHEPSQPLLGAGGNHTASPEVENGNGS